jgi:hypothetical protein
MPRKQVNRPRGHKPGKPDIIDLKERLSETYEANSESGDLIFGPNEGAVTDVSVTRRLALLDQRLPGLKGKSASEYVREIFPEIARIEAVEAIPPIPNEAPEPWVKARREGEEISTFVFRVYGTWIGHGLTRSTLRKLDKTLYLDLYRPGNATILASLGIPTLKEYNDELVAQLRATGQELRGAPTFGPSADIRRGISVIGHRAKKRPHRSP